MDRRRYTYYVILFLGLVLVSLYFLVLYQWVGLSSLASLLLVGSGGLFILLALVAPFGRSRPARLGLTALCGLIAGTHAYLDIILLQGQMGTVMFIWIGLGTMLVTAPLRWLKE